MSVWSVPMLLLIFIWSAPPRGQVDSTRLFDRFLGRSKPQNKCGLSELFLVGADVTPDWESAPLRGALNTSFLDTYFFCDAGVTFYLFANYSRSISDIWLTFAENSMIFVLSFTYQF